jgi:hypothetical protein
MSKCSAKKDLFAAQKNPSRRGNFLQRKMADIGDNMYPIWFVKKYNLNGPFCLF